MSKKLIQELRENFEKDINNMGYEIVDIEYVKEDGENYLRFFIYNPEGTTLDDTEKVSRYLDPKLDELDPIKDGYYLEVSSPDLNRPLKNNDDLRRNLGVEIDVRLYKKINGIKEYSGILTNYDDENIILEINEEEIVLDRKDISIIKVALKF